MSSTKRAIAINASVCGLKFLPTASGVSQLRRQARRESLATASLIAERIAALEPVGHDQHGGAARIATEARNGEKRLQRVADAGAAVPVADQLRSGGQRLFAPLETQRPGHPRQPRAEGEDLDPRAH